MGIETNLEDMLRKERDLSEQVEEFTVTVQKFKRGSVVCDFKVNYILKEAYIAIPFAIKPSNITTALGNNFKFKKGILFQRFLIAGGSFNASSPVDHCAAKGCSHKCNYDYDLEDYLCTCPPSLQLASDSRICVEVGEETSSRLPEIVVNVVPSDCLWSSWSDWSVCSVECGKGKRERKRTIEIPERNGGSCLGRNQEFEECEEICQGTTEVSEVEIITAAPTETPTGSDGATEASTVAETDMDIAAENRDVERSTETVGSTTVTEEVEKEATTEAVEQGEEQFPEEVKPLTDDVSAATTEEVATESPTEAETVKIIFPLPEDPTETTTEFGIKLGPVTEQTDAAMTTEAIDESMETDMEVTTEKQMEEETKTEITTVTIDGKIDIATSTLRSVSVTSEDAITTLTTSEATTLVEKETESVENVDVDEIVVTEEEQTTVATTVAETTAAPKETEDEPSKRPRLEDEAVEVETTTTDETTTTGKVIETEVSSTEEPVKPTTVIDTEISTTEEPSKPTTVSDITEVETEVITTEEPVKPTTVSEVETEASTTEEPVKPSTTEPTDTTDHEQTTIVGISSVDERTTTEKVMDTMDETFTTEKVMEATTEVIPSKRPRLEDEAVEVETEKAMVTDETSTTTEKVLEAVDETTTVMYTVDETTTTVMEVTTTEKVMEAVDVSSTSTEATDETTTMGKIMEDETTTMKDMLTTVEVVAISESDDDMTVVTTLRPRLDEEAFADSTTVQPVQDDQMFLCQPGQTGDDSGDIPMNCEHVSGDQEKSVMLLIPTDVIGDRINRLFDKNVKIVVRDFMLMDRSPRRL